VLHYAYNHEFAPSSLHHTLLRGQELDYQSSADKRDSGLPKYRQVYWVDCLCPSCLSDKLSRSSTSAKIVSQTSFTQPYPTWHPRSFCRLKMDKILNKSSSHFKNWRDRLYRRLCPPYHRNRPSGVLHHHTPSQCPRIILVQVPQHLHRQR
jgi:hypothetical protein